MRDPTELNEAGCHVRDLQKVYNSSTFAMFSRSVRWFCGLRDSLLDQARRVALHNADSQPELARALAILDRFDAGRTYSCVEEEDSTGCMAGHEHFGQVTLPLSCA